MTVAWSEALLWAAFATALLSIVLAAGLGLGLTRASVPLLLGTVFTRERRLAMTLGSALHLLLGLTFGLGYALVFELWPWGATWRSGAALGAAHAAAALLVGPALLWAHPRVARVREGPTLQRRIEPPGWLGLAYGRLTPAVSLAGHLVFGVTLGAFYST